jgi:hypothetical protein
MSFPNQLSDPKPLRLPLPGAAARLVLLLAMCLVPRIWMAERIDGICPDGAFYIDKAEHLAKDGPPAVQDTYDFNLYLLVLGAWHRAGLDWETASTVWGVLAGSLAVLPLFGWARRMFDDRVALLAGVLYAVHPKLIEWSPEAVRDPTFWLLFTTSLYCSWRAITEVCPGWFLAAGTATFLAANTRFEGWFLLLPVAAWCGWRWLALHQARRQLAGGMALFALGYPLVMATLVYCHGHPQWHWGRFQRLEMVVKWAHAQWNAADVPAERSTDRPAGAVAQPQHPLAAAPPAHAPADGPAPLAGSVALESDASALARSVATRPTPGRTALLVLDKVARGFTAVFGVLVLLGMARWWRLCLRRDHLPLVLVVVITLAAVWVHATEAHMSSTRYLLPPVILAMPLAALGLLPICRWAAWLARRAAPHRAVAPFAAASGVLAAVLIAGTIDAVTSRVDSRNAKADLGAWLEEHCGHPQRIAGSGNWRLTVYHAGGAFHPLPWFSSDLTPAWFGRMLSDTRPDVLLLCRRRLPGTLVHALSQQASQRGFEPIPPDDLPDSCRDRVTVLVHGSTHVATRPGERSSAARDARE